MTDQDLLELAAMAYFGADGFEWNACSGYIEYIPTGSRSYARWKPLTDDGDALRLAVQLGLVVSVRACEECPFIVVSPARQLERHESSIVEEFGDDRFASTRRAIVRAAAKRWI